MCLQIVYNGWYAIKSNQTKPNQTKGNVCIYS